MSSYTRSNPSPRFQQLVAMYREMHVDGSEEDGIPADQTFSGISLGPHLARIKRLVEATNAQNILDYGCGKGQLYDLRDAKLASGEVVDSVQDYWNVDYVHLYDPGYAPFSKLPTTTFDGVVCTDVLEHCPEEDLPWLIGELFDFAERFVFMTIASYPAVKHLPNGENAHITIRPPEWWRDLVQTVAARRPTVTWEARVEVQKPGPDGKWLNENFSIRGGRAAA